MLRECDYCHLEDVTVRRRPMAEYPYLCVWCWTDVQLAWMKEREEP